MGFAIMTQPDFYESTNGLVAEIILFGAIEAKKAWTNRYSIRVPLTGSETAVQIRDKIVDAIVSGALSMGITLARTDILLPAYQRGQ